MRNTRAVGTTVYARVRYDGKRAGAAACARKSFTRCATKPCTGATGSSAVLARARAATGALAAEACLCSDVLSNIGATDMAEAKKYPYTSVPNNLRKLLQKIPTLGAPDKATQKWLESVGAPRQQQPHPSAGASPYRGHHSG